MIRVEASADGLVLEADLSPGSTAYIDAEWVGDVHLNGVPAVIVQSQGTVSWCDGEQASFPDGIDPDAAAGAAFLSAAREAAAAVEGLEGTIEVIGDGVIASYVSLLLGHGPVRSQPGGEVTAPAAIVDTTGNPEAIAEATRRVCDLGTIVLAGESRGRSLTLDLYPDVHVRGLRLVGVRPPLEGLHEEAFRDPRVEFFRESLQDVVSGTLLRRHAVCYRVSPKRLAPPGSQSSPARA